MYKHTQRSFAGGRLDRELMGRQDLEKYFTGASELKNLLVRRQGNLAKRRGTNFSADLTDVLGFRSRTAGGEWGGHIALGAHRILPIVEERERGYYVLLADRRAFLLDSRRGILCSDGAWRRSAAPYLAPAEGDATVAATGVSIATPYVARIGRAFYGSLEEAAQAMRPGDTIYVGTDVALDGAIVLRGTVDLRGHVLAMSAKDRSVEFDAGSGVRCGIVSTLPGGRMEWTAAGVTAHGIVHTSGILELRDISADFPSTAANAAFLHSTDVDLGDRIEITRCTLSAHCGLGVVHLHGTAAGASSTAVDGEDGVVPDPYSWWQAGALLRGCDIAYATSRPATATASNPCPFTTGVLSAAVRRFSFAGGRVRCSGRVAANIGLTVYGGALDCAGVGLTTQHGDATSKVVRALCSVQIEQAYLAAGTSANAAPEQEDSILYYGYTDEGYASSPEYSLACNVWARPEWNDGEEVDELPAGEGSAASLTAGEAPYCVALPYADGELDELDFFQSGDTLFLAHRLHAPARMVFDPDALTLSFARLSFNAARWRRPVLLSARESVHLAQNTLQYSGSTKTVTTVRYSGRSKTTAVAVNDVQKASTSTTLPARTVTYCVTYVKDGEESPPSNPLSVTYGAPWEEGGTIELSFSRGGNAEEPDYYNVYKKTSTAYGLIGSTSRPAGVDRAPKAYGYVADGERAMSPGLLPNARMDGATVGATEREDVLGETPQDAFGGEAAGELDGFVPRAGCGGMRFGAGAAALLEFGEESRVAADTVVLAFDAHTLAYESVTDADDPDFGRVRVYDDMLLSGASAEVAVMHQPISGESRALSVETRTVDLGPVEAGGEDPVAGPLRRLCGTVGRSASKAAVEEVASFPLRRAEIVFPALSGGDRQVVRVVVTCRDGNGDVCECVLAGFALRRAAATETTFADDYITPDMSLSPPSDDAAFAARGDYPSCVGMYQQRLVFAATASRPFAFWMSAVGDLYTFAAHDSVREDDAISAELAATEFPRINHVVFNRDLVLLSDGGEWRIAPATGNALTYKTLSATLQSRIGSAKWLKPLAVGSEVIFAERTGAALRSVVYSYASDGYETRDLTVLAGGIFAGNAVRRMCYKQHPDSTIVCVLADGTVAAMVYMPEHEVAAWTRHVLGGGARAVECATCKALNGSTTDVALVVRRGGRAELWAVRPDDPSMTVAAQACMDGCRVLSAAAAVAQWQDGWLAVDLLTAAVHATFDALEAGRDYLCGFPFEAELVTVRPEPPSQGTIQFEVKNANDVEARILDGGSWRAAPLGYSDHPVYSQRVERPPSAVDGALALDSSDHRLLLTGANSGDGRVQIKSDDPWPLSVLSLSVDYEIQPLSNSEG